VLGGAARRAHRREVERDPHPRARPVLAQPVDGQAVREQQVVRDAQRGRPVAHAGGLRALDMAEDGHDPRLVVGDPGADRVAELARHVLGVLGEALRRRALGPAATVLERLRQVPVVERGDRLDPPLAQPLGQPAVEVDASPVERSLPVRLHARPSDREAIGLQAELRHQVEVLAPAVVVVAGDLAGLAAGHRAGHAAEGVPDRVAAPVLAHRSLDLVRRRGRAEPHLSRERRLHFASDDAR
jgi:hypothetical protein